ncbi:MAG: MipA/OmpV family protein [Novosphingobium sp.]
MAQDATDEGVFGRDHVTVGIGGFYGPSYDGSDDYIVSPFPAVQGRVRGIDITPRMAGVALDVLPDGKNARFGIAFGPVAGISFNRSTRIKDPVVRAAGKLDTAVELGVNGGVTAYKLLNDYDSLALSTDVKWDVGGAYKGMTWAPSISYLTPVSKAVLVALSVSAHHADWKYARYYYSVTPAQSVASGLPEFAAQSGWDSANVGALLGWNVSGDWRNGGFALFGIASYARMLGYARRTPYTAIRGDAGQWTAGAGVAYTF